MSNTSDTPATPYTPLASPLPPPPEEDVFTPDQWTVLLAIADAIIPSIRSPDTADPSTQLSVSDSELNAAKTHIQNGLDDPNSEESAQLVTSYLEESASSVPQFKDSLKTIFGRHIHHEGRKGLTLVLTALKYVSLPLLGHLCPRHSEERLVDR